MYYSIKELAAIPGYINPTGVALNDNGDIAGTVWKSLGSGNLDSYGAIWYADGSTQVLPVQSELKCINDEGTAAGASWTNQPADPYSQAIAVRNKTMVVLESTAGGDCGAWCINYASSGDSLACVTDDQGNILAIDTDSATPVVKFKIKAADYSVDSFTPTTIDENSNVAGWAYYDPTHTSPSFLYKGGVMMSNTPAQGGILDLNGFGAGGGYYSETGFSEVPAIWDINGSLEAPIQKPMLSGCNGGMVYGINDHGSAVGYCSNSLNPDTRYAFVFDGTTTYDLNTLVQTSGWIILQSWSLQSAEAINSSGQILATGTLNGTPTSFLLTPIASPSPGSAWRVNVNALASVMLFGGAAVDGGGIGVPGGRIPPSDPGGPPILSPAARDVIVGLAVNAVASRLGDRVGAEAIQKAALEMTARAVNSLMAQIRTNASQSVLSPGAAARPVRPRGRFPFPPRRSGAKQPKG